MAAPKLDVAPPIQDVEHQTLVKFRRRLVVVAVVSVMVGWAIGTFIARSPNADVTLTPPPGWGMVCPPCLSGTEVLAIATITPEPLHIYVSGAVVKPQVVTLAPNCLMLDAVEAAGGATADADLEALNLAAPLVDHQHVIVPNYVPVLTTGSPSVADSLEVMGDLININTATASELECLPHIGPALAQRIIDYREAQGHFKQKADLQNVSGIGPSRYNDIEPMITVGQ